MDILKKFKMINCKSMPTPMVMNLKKMKKDSYNSREIDPHIYRQLIRSLMYLVNTRPDICYVVSVLNQFMSQSRHTNWKLVKHVLRYLRGTVDYGLRYSYGVNMRL
jgi:3-methyladenine DNA glycosylase AlkC